LAEIKNLIEADKASRVKESADYKAHAEEIKEMVDAGIEEGKAINFVLAKAASTSDKSALPASMPDGRVTTTKTESSYWASAEERAQFVATYGEEETKKLETAGEARLKRTSEEVV